MYHHINAIIIILLYGFIIYGIIETDSFRKSLCLIVGIIGIFIYPIIIEILYNLGAKIFCRNENNSTHNNKHIKYQNKTPICYSEDYNITACGLEKYHPFDSCKYRNVYNIIKDTLRIKSQNIINPNLISRSTLLERVSSIHLILLNYSIYISKCVELILFFLPSEFLRYRLLNPMLKATQGSLECACMALEHGWAINLSGGYHHATLNSGGGFCIYPDITLAVHHIRKWHSDLVKKVMIIDLDAHQGNGHERDFLDDEDVFILDCYNPHIYPGDQYAKKSIKKEILVYPNHTDDEYLDLLEKGIAESFEKFKPDFIVFNAGTDCMEGDPLGRNIYFILELNLSKMGIIKRDEIVFSFAFNYNIPIMMVLSGGYQIITAPVIAESIQNIFNKFKLNEKMNKQII